MFGRKFISSVSLHCFNRPHRNLFSAQTKKFYKNVTIFQSSHENYEHPVFQILLDQRKLRTPTGIHFHVPNEALAVAVAHEWDSQDSTIKRYTMPLTTLCNRALDTPADQHDILVGAIMQYADKPDDLVTVQSAAWDPIIEWVRQRHQIKPVITYSMTSLAKLSPLDKEKLIGYLNSYNIWGLSGIKSCVENLKSVYLTLAMLDGFCSAARAVELSQIEMLFQVSRWRDVPSYHDVENADLNARVSAALFLALLSHYRHDIKTNGTNK
ncbi:ATP synthase mitochondrial F1 complex assembly factor 2 [Schistosoma japonicum]|nr:ATP synthase mitochondrial F1 complex assembly factor 2 [Schistosoma japonicum]